MEAQVFTAIGGVIALLSVGALIKVVRIFLRHIEAADKRQDLAQERQEIFLGNHLSASTAAMQSAARAQEKVAERLERVETAVRQSPVVKVKNPDEVEVG